MTVRTLMLRSLAACVFHTRIKTPTPPRATKPLTHFELVVNDHATPLRELQTLTLYTKSLPMDTKVASLLRSLRNEDAPLLAIPEDVKGTI
jgi:hypothetical protein